MVSRQLASALASSGQLAAYASGVVATDRSVSGRVLSGMAGQFPIIKNRLLDLVPADKVISLGALELAARLAGRMTSSVGIRKISTYDALFLSHDAGMSVVRWPECNAIYAYEDGALLTFRRAKRKGKLCIWDLPTPHYHIVQQVWKDELHRWPEASSIGPPLLADWKKSRKDCELAVTDIVSVASEFTRQSLLRIGCSKPILVAPYGFPTEHFQPKRKPLQGPFTVLSVGSQNVYKGTTYLLEAWRRADLPDAQLRLIGPLKLKPTFLAQFGPSVKHVPPVPRLSLAQEYQNADLLAFPALGDGFGLVIQEAMCSATPVLTTTSSGGPECIDDKINGFLCPPRDIDSLVELLRWGSNNRNELYAMGRRARHHAESFGWLRAGQNLIEQLSNVGYACG